MKSFEDKVFEGMSPTQEDWNNFLKTAHEKAPSMSPAAYGDCCNSSGLNSYQWLVQGLECTSNQPTILDLACGDGYLIPHIQKKFPSLEKVIGIDMSEAELEVARNRPLGELARFIHTSAQDLKLEDESVDIVACHMAFMLMLPLEPVVAEIKRVLKPGGRFVAVVNNKKDNRGVMLGVQESVAKFLKDEFPNMAKPLTGDPRVESEKGLTSLFSSFSGPLQIESDQFGCQVSFGGLWEHIKNMYIITMLPANKNSRLIRRLIEKLGDTDLNLEFAMRRFSIQK